jgi:histidinol-phosphatase (PHP family)
MPWANFHNHSEYCDGVGTLESHIQAAINQNVKVLGFSSHAPLPFATPWAMPSDKLAKYSKEIEFLRQKYGALLELYLGLEVDYIPKAISPTDPAIQQLNLDFTIGSVHFVDASTEGKPWEIDNTTKIFKAGLSDIFADNIKKAIKRYYELTRKMLKKNTPDILGHLDKIKIHNKNEHFFSEKEKWYKKEIQDTLEVVAKVGCVLEVNTSAIYKKGLSDPYPSYWVLSEALEQQIPIMINSDAHSNDKITQQFAEVAQKLLKIGYREVRILYAGKWQNVELSPKGLKLD